MGSNDLRETFLFAARELNDITLVICLSWMASLLGLVRKENP